MKKRGIFSIEERFGQIVKPKRNHLLRNIIIGVIALIVVILCSIGFLNLLQKNCVEDLETWTSSLPSYWGGIIGGIISGLLSFLGVYLTIRYYRNSDLTKNRVEHMPFININLDKAEISKVEEVADENLIEVPGRFYEIDKNNVVIMDVLLENIGNSFANTLVLKLNKNVGGESYQKLLKVGDKEKLQLKFYLNDAQHVSRISFGLQYVDSMTNEYIQIYTVNCKNHIGFISVDDLKELITIENGYPQFLGQVHHLGE